MSIGINVPLYPQLVRVPNYPVYYAPGLASNYFFYDGLYWVYQDDNWYASTWYDGPWGLVQHEVVPVYLLRIPVRYYRRPPAHFRGWQADAPPRWGEHWGPAWQGQRSGWDQWNRRTAPAPAPLPIYQRQYSADRYPQAVQQRALRSQNYRYQPRDAVAQQHYRQPVAQSAAVPVQEQPQRDPRPQRDAPRQDTAEKKTPPGQGAAQDPKRARERGRGQDKDRDQGGDRVK